MPTRWILCSLSHGAISCRRPIGEDVQLLDPCLSWYEFSSRQGNGNSFISATVAELVSQAHTLSRGWISGEVVAELFGNCLEPVKPLDKFRIYEITNCITQVYETYCNRRHVFSCADIHALCLQIEPPPAESRQQVRNQGKQPAAAST